jgi:hypothetical protein
MNRMPKDKKAFIRPLSQREPLGKFEVSITIRLRGDSLVVGGRQLRYLEVYALANPVLN